MRTLTSVGVRRITGADACKMLRGEEGSEADWLGLCPHSSPGVGTEGTRSTGIRAEL